MYFSCTYVNLYILLLSQQHDVDLLTEETHMNYYQRVPREICVVGASVARRDDANSIVRCGLHWVFRKCALFIGFNEHSRLVGDSGVVLASTMYEQCMQMCVLAGRVLAPPIDVGIVDAI